MSEDGDNPADTAGPDHLLVLAHSRPAEALAQARAVLSGRPQVASAMMPMGTVGIVAAVVPVSDRITPGIMDCLHERVAQGAGFPDALRLARMAAVAADDPVALATACSFLALGA
jgi:hypothetical protein